jgi:endoglucanase
MFTNKKLVLIALVAFAHIANSFAQQNIFVNQVGYEPNAFKPVYTDYKADSFAVVDIKTKQTLAFFPFSLRKTNDPCSGKTVYEGDFSAITTPGEYVIRVFSPLNSGITSYSFKIGSKVYLPLINTANKSLFLQRCGIEIEEKHAGKYARPKCHLDAATYHHTCTQQGKRDVSGGWHDAGDYGKYMAPGSVTAAVLLQLYQLKGLAYASDNWNIPESGNGIPDMLDEVKYELDWMFKMQRTDGAVHEKIHTKDYVQFIMPHEGTVPQYIYEVSSTATADFAAVMALASRIYTDFDKNFADHCLDASLKAYAYLDENKQIFPKGGFKNPEDTKAGGYSDAYDKDERIWAAAELYVTTGKKKYLQDFKAYFEEINCFSAISWVSPATLGFYSIVLNDSKDNKDLQNTLTEKLASYCDKHLDVASKDGFGIGMKANDYTWGSNGSVVSKAMNFILAYQLTNNEDYKKMAAQHIHYILGMNPNKKCYVTGFGSNPIRHLHHAPSVSDAVPQPIPGILSGGPNMYRDDQSLINTFPEGTPPALVFLDNEESYSSNENTIYTNTYLVFVLALLSK